MICLQRVEYCQVWFDLVWFGLVWFYGISIIYCQIHFYTLTIQFQTVQFNISTQITCIWPIVRTLSGVTTPSQSGPGSDGNKGVLHIPQSSFINGASSSDCLVTYNQDTHWGSLPPLQRCSWCILQPQMTGHEYCQVFLSYTNNTI